jgi:F-type H+-transporting ATPase subunit gamma
MPSLKAIRKRIASVKNTRKITKAMKLISAAKLRRAQRAISDARPYAVRLHTVISSLALRGDREAHPLLKRPENPQQAVLVVISSDRGFCGGFNATLMRQVDRFMRENEGKYPKGISVAVCGRKGREYVRRKGYPLFFEKTDVLAKPSIETSRGIVEPIVEAFVSDDHHVDEVFLLYNTFKSAIAQTPTLTRLLPLEPLEVEEGNTFANDFIYEPSRGELLSYLLPLYTEIQLFRAILESSASEHAARMTAMDAASKNSNELIGSLTLVYNRARQAAITKELVEIVSGAESLKG